MSHGRLITALGVTVLLAAPSFAAAQSRDRGNSRGDRGRYTTGRAVPRGSVSRPSVRVVRPRVVVPVVRPRVVPYGYRSYRPSFGVGIYPGYRGYYGYNRPYRYVAPAYGYGYPAYGYPAYGYGASGYGVGVQPYGGLRIDLPQRDAEVYVDGYFVGIVDDFDGALQQVNLEPGPHRIEVRAEGFEPIAFDVNAQPNRTTTYRAGMQPLRP